MKKSISSIIFTLLAVFSIVTPAMAAGILGYSDPPGCESKDPFLPNLVICGRNPSSLGGQCQQYTKPCSVGDLVETGSRFLIWLITFTLLITPLFVMYYGAMIVIKREMGGGFDLKYWKGKLGNAILYFILMLAAWLIVRTVVDIFQVDERINTFMIDENGQQVKARSFNVN